MANFQFKPAKGSVKDRKRRGRGNASGLGGESGRGHKGQKSRSGYSSRAGFEGGQTPLYRKMPKKKGMNNLFRVEYFPLNVGVLNELFQEGDSILLESLIEKGLIKSGQKVKVLSNGVLEKKLVIHAHKFSKAAVEKITAAHGSTQIIN